MGFFTTTPPHLRNTHFSPCRSLRVTIAEPWFVDLDPNFQHSPNGSHVSVLGGGNGQKNVYLGHSTTTRGSSQLHSLQNYSPMYPWPSPSWVHGSLWYFLRTTTSLLALAAGNVSETPACVTCSSWSWLGDARAISGFQVLTHRNMPYAWFDTSHPPMTFKWLKNQSWDREKKSCFFFKQTPTWQVQYDVIHAPRMRRAIFSAIYLDFKVLMIFPAFCLPHREDKSPLWCWFN